MMINSVENTKDSEDLFIRKGQLKVLAYLLNFENNMETSFNELEKENEGRQRKKIKKSKE